MPRWLTVTVWPATVSVADRCSGFPFASTLKLSVELPVPEVEDSLTQPASLDAVQPHAAPLADTPTLPAFAVSEKIGFALLIVKLQGTPSCVIRNGWPPMIRKPERDWVLEFAATVNVSAPLPVPDAPDVTVTQLGPTTVL